jgi:hypothetical protein
VDNWRLTTWAVCIGIAAASGATGQELNAPQIDLIKQTANDVCNTVKDARGQRNNQQIEGDVQAKLSGLPGKLIDLGGTAKGSISHEDFEGLTREATAIALTGDRECRERLFNKMFDRLSFAPSPKIPPVRGVIACSAFPGYPLGRWRLLVATESVAKYAQFINFTRPNGGTWFPYTGQGSFRTSARPSPGAEVNIEFRPDSSDYRSVNRLVVSPDGCRMSGTYSDSEGRRGEATYVYDSH